MTPCDRCGVTLAIGDYPFCPHGRGVHASHGDELDYWDHNLGKAPIHIRSKAQRKALMQAQGLEEKVRHVPGSKHTMDWSARMDPYTLANAKILAERQATTKATNDPVLAPPPVRWWSHDEAAREAGV